MAHPFSLALAVCAGLLVLLALLVYTSFLAARYFFVQRSPDEIHYATTEDGWRIGVCRFRPTDRKYADPVLLVHGIAANHLTYDLTDRLSLAMHLQRAGFDVWVVDLRGRGNSIRPRLFSGLKYEWSFDEYAEKDLPVAVREVARATGAERVHLVGFSVGALACYAYLSGPRRDVPIGSLVSLGGAATFKRIDRFLSARLIRSLRWLRHRWLMRVLAPGSGYLHPSPLQLIYNPENTDGATQRRAMVNAVASFASNELLQYADWIKTDSFRSIDHRRDYRAELARIAVPTLFIAGARDAFAAPDAVKETADAMTGVTDKEFRIASRAQGLRVNYGHFDMLWGRDAPDEIYPMVEHWLARRIGSERRDETSSKAGDDAGFGVSS